MPFRKQKYKQTKIRKRNKIPQYAKMQNMVYKSTTVATASALGVYSATGNFSRESAGVAAIGMVGLLLSQSYTDSKKRNTDFAGLCGELTQSGTPCRNKVREGGPCHLHQTRQ